MARTNIPNGHKHLTSEVVSGQTREAGGRVFERQWPRSARFSREKLRDRVAIR